MSARPRALLLHPILEPGLSLLKEACEVVEPDPAPLFEEPAIRRLAEGCQAILSQVMDPIGETVLATPGLRIVANCAVGFNNIDLAAATRHMVMVTNTPGVLDETTADFAFTLMAAAARRVAEGDRMVRAGRFGGWAIDMLLGQDLHDAGLGIVGMGRIGRALARRARGFGMRILYTDDANPLPPEAERELEATRMDLRSLLAEADFVSLHVPLLPETRHLIGASELELMKPTAVLVNTSRGPVVDEAALVSALRAGTIFAAGIDVYENEPEVDPGLLGLDNVVLTPHIASASVATRSEMSEVAARNLVTGVRGGRPPNLLNPEVLER